MGSTTGSIIINVKGKDVTVGVNAPANPKDNELWLDTNDGQNILKYYSSKDKKWHNVNDMSGEFGKIYTELKTNYYTKTESDNSVKTIIGETTITKSDGKVVNMKDAINSVIDTSNSHTTQIGKIETKFSDYSTIEDVNSKITKAQQTSEDYTIEAIKNLNIGAANLINGSTIYTENNKLSLTATKDDFSNIIGNIYVDLEKDETYTFNCKTDGIYGINGDTVEVFFLKDRAYTTFFRPSSLPYTFNCTESGRYYLRVDVNKKGSTHSFWNFKMERGNKATDWSINPVEEQATLKVSSDKINAVVSSLDSEGSITLTNKMAKVVADTISLNGTVKVNGNMLVNGAVTVDKIATDAIKSKNYIDPDETTTPYSKDGTFLNLNNGNIISPVFTVDPENKKGYLKNIEITGGSIRQESLISESSSGSETRVTSELTIEDGHISLIPYFNGKPYALGALHLRCAMGNGQTSEILLGSTQNGFNTKIDTTGITTNYFDCTDFIRIGNSDKYIKINESNNSTISVNGVDHVETAMYGSTGIKYGVVIDTKSFRPCGNGSSVISDAFNTRCAPLNLGLSNHRWASICAASSTIVTSDKNEKHDISDITRELAKSIILGVQPKAYKYNDGTSGRTHYGIISQDIEQLLNDLHLSSLDFAGFVKSPKLKEYVVDVLDDNGEAVLNSDGTPLTEIKTEEIEGEYIYSLRYEEFISPLIKVVQEHEKEIEELKNKNTELENKYNDLLSRIEKLENTEGSN